MRNCSSVKIRSVYNTQTKKLNLIRFSCGDHRSRLGDGPGDGHLLVLDQSNSQQIIPAKRMSMSLIPNLTGSFSRIGLLP